MDINNLKFLINILNKSGIDINDKSINIRPGVYPKTINEASEKYINICNIPLDIILEKHHYYYGNPWCKEY
jgi:hypothetical protein